MHPKIKIVDTFKLYTTYDRQIFRWICANVYNTQNYFWYRSKLVFSFACPSYVYPHVFMVNAQVDMLKYRTNVLSHGEEPFWKCSGPGHSYEHDRCNGREKNVKFQTYRRKSLILNLSEKLLLEGPIFWSPCPLHVYMNIRPSHEKKSNF